MVFAIVPARRDPGLLSLPKRWLRPSRRSRRQSDKRRPSRHVASDARVVLASGLGAVWGTNDPAARLAVPRRLRPPGSVAESRFTGLCLRCGNCAQACPSKIIVPETGGQGLAGFLAPVVRFQDSYCLEDCRRCTQVCPSGAIAPLSLEDKRRASIGLAR